MDKKDYDSGSRNDYDPERREFLKAGIAALISSLGLSGCSIGKIVRVNPPTPTPTTPPPTYDGTLSLTHGGEAVRKNIYVTSSPYPITIETTEYVPDPENVEGIIQTTPVNTSIGAISMQVKSDGTIDDITTTLSTPGECTFQGRLVHPSGTAYSNSLLIALYGAPVSQNVNSITNDYDTTGMTALSLSDFVRAMRPDSFFPGYPATWSAQKKTYADELRALLDNDFVQLIYNTTLAQWGEWYDGGFDNLELSNLHVGLNADNKYVFILEATFDGGVLSKDVRASRPDNTVFIEAEISEEAAQKAAQFDQTP